MSIWKEIINYPNYKISNNGEIKSICYNKEKLLKTQDMNGYLRVGLSKNGKVNLFLIHRLVAIAFLENTENHNFINHKNGIKSDNKVENLEWCNSSENLNHALTNNLRVMPKGINHHNSKLTEEQVLEIRKSNLSQTELALKYNVKQPLISSIINKRKWKHL
jgi:hypothetical protein